MTDIESVKDCITFSPKPVDIEELFERFPDIPKEEIEKIPTDISRFDDFDNGEVVFLKSPYENEIFTPDHVRLDYSDMLLIQDVIAQAVAFGSIRPDEAILIAAEESPEIKRNNPYISDDCWAAYLQYLFRKDFKFEPDGWMIYPLDE